MANYMEVIRKSCMLSGGWPCETTYSDGPLSNGTASYALKSMSHKLVH